MHATMHYCTTAQLHLPVKLAENVEELERETAIDIKTSIAEGGDVRC
jgi:hypothetical protein